MINMKNVSILIISFIFFTVIKVDVFANDTYTLKSENSYIITNKTNEDIRIKHGGNSVYVVVFNVKGDVEDYGTNIYGYGATYRVLANAKTVVTVNKRMSGFITPDAGILNYDSNKLSVETSPRPAIYYVQLGYFEESSNQVETVKFSAKSSKENFDLGENIHIEWNLMDSVDHYILKVKGGFIDANSPNVTDSYYDGIIIKKAGEYEFHVVGVYADGTAIQSNTITVTVGDVEIKYNEDDSPMLENPYFRVVPKTIYLDKEQINEYNKDFATAKLNFGNLLDLTSKNNVYGYDIGKIVAEVSEVEGKVELAIEGMDCIVNIVELYKDNGDEIANKYRYLYYTDQEYRNEFNNAISISLDGELADLSVEDRINVVLADDEKLNDFIDLIAEGALYWKDIKKWDKLNSLNKSLEKSTTFVVNALFEYAF